MNTFQIERAESAQAMEACARIRAEVYSKERGILPVEAIQDGMEFDEFDAHSYSMLGRDSDGQPAGTFRLILPTGPQLPVERHFGVAVDTAQRYGELSRLAVRPAYRGHTRGHVLMIGLCRAMYDLVVGEGLAVTYAVLEPGLLRFLTAVGFPFVQLGPPKKLPGDPFETVPTSLDTPDILPGLEKSEAEGTECLRLASYFAAPFTGRVSVMDLL